MDLLLKMRARLICVPISPVPVYPYMHSSECQNRVQSALQSNLVNLHSQIVELIVGFEIGSVPKPVWVAQLFLTDPIKISTHTCSYNDFVCLLLKSS